MVIWKPLMELGIPELDQQHRKLVCHLEELGSAMKKGKGRDTVSQLLKYLRRYAAEHFALEESLMEREQYPKFAEHRNYHETFKQELESLVEEFAANPTDRGVILRIHGWIMEWLGKHTISADGEMGDFLKSRCRPEP